MRSFALFLIAFCLPLSLGAQQLQGRIVNRRGQALPYVTISAYNAERQLCHATLSDSLGFFQLPLQNNCGCPLHLRAESVMVQEQNWQLNYLPDTLLTLSVMDTIQLSLIELYALPELGQSLSSQRFDAAQLQQNAQGTLAKLLERVPGVKAMNVGVGIAKPVIRGLSGNRIGVFYNGLRQEGQQWGNDHGLEADPFDLESVEVLRGANSLRYGGDLTGGLILLHSLRRLSHKQIQAQFQQLYKSNNHHWASSLHLAAGFRAWTFSLRASQQSFADYRVPAQSFTYNGYELPLYEGRLKNSAGLERSLSGYIGYQWPKKIGQSYLVGSLYALDAGLFAGAMGIPRAYALTPDGDWRNRSLPKQQILHSRLLLQHRGHFGDWEWFGLVGYQRNLRREYSYPHLHNRPNTDSTFVALNLDLHNQQAQFFLRSPLQHDLRWELGAQAQWQQHQQWGFEFLLPNFRSQGMGAYALASYTWSDAWRLDVALRLDQLQHRSDLGGVYAQNSLGEWGFEARVPALQRQFLGWAAALNLQYQPSSQWLWILRGQKSFRPPYLNELAANGIHHGTFRHELGQANLQAEQGYQVELQGQWKSRSNHLQAQVNAYASRYANFIYLQPSARFSPLPEAGQLYRYAQSPAVFVGTEAQYWWQARPWLRWEQSLDWIWSLNLDSGLGLPFMPPASLYTQLDLSNPWATTPSPWAFWLGYRYQTAQMRTDRNEKTTPHAQVLDLGAHYRFTFKKQSLQLGLQLHNAFNRANFQHLSRYRILNLPEQGRNWVLSLQWQLK